jgi:tRNA A37 methylthiotransferase MiaB
VIIPGELKKGEFVEVEITDAIDYDLLAEIVK